MAAPAAEKSFDELDAQLRQGQGGGTTAPAAPAEKSFDELDQQLRNRSFIPPAATVAPSAGPRSSAMPAPRSSTTPVLPHVGSGAAAPPVVRPGTGPVVGPPRPAGPPNYARDRQTISATIADLNRQKPDLDREQHALGLRFQKLEQTRQEIDKGVAISRERPLEWGEDRGIKLEIKRQQYESERQQFQMDQDAAKERARAYHEAVTRAQGEQARLKFAPATAVIPKAPTFTPAPFPEQTLFLQAEDQLRRNPPGVAAPGRWPAGRLPAALQHQQLAAGRFHLAVQARMKELAQLGPDLAAAADQMAPYQKQLKAGSLSPADERRVVQAGMALRHQVNLYNNTLKQYQTQDQRAVKFLSARLAAGYLPHGEGEYPEDIALKLGHPQGWLEQHADQAGNVIQQSIWPQATAAKRKELAILGTMMVTGESPPLPPNPGKTPGERQHFRDVKDDVLGLITREGLQASQGISAPDDPFMNPRTDPARLAREERALMRDPWARQLFPILRAQAKAREKAAQMANVDLARAKDAAILIPSMLAGELAAAGAALGISKIPGVAALLSEPLFGAGAKAFLKGLGARMVVRGVTSASGFTGFGSTHAGLTAASQGKGLTGSLREAARAAPRSAAVGFGVGAGEALAGVGVAGVLRAARGLAPRSGPSPGGSVSEVIPPSLGPAPSGPSGPLNLPEDYRMGPSPQTAPEATAQIQALEKITPTAQAELQAATAAGADATKAAAAAPNAVQSLIGPGASPESLTAAEIQAQAQRLVDHLKARAADLQGALPELARVDAEVAAGMARAGGVQAPPRPTVFDPTLEEAAPLVSQGRPPSPGGYDQAPAGLDAGPAVTAPAGTPVPFRYQTPPVLAGLVTQLQQDGSPESLAALPVVQGYVVRAQQYDQGRQVPPELLDQVTSAFKDPREPAQIAFRIISKAAANARDPEMAARLAAAAKGVQDDFGEFYLGTLPDAQSRDTGVDLAPPFVSPYRTLSGADRASLDPETRRALLIQDIANSTRVLHPGTPPFFTVPGSVSQLSNQADNLFRLAQRQALQTEVARSTPAPAPAAPQAPAQPPYPGQSVRFQPQPNPSSSAALPREGRLTESGVAPREASVPLKVAPARPRHETPLAHAARLVADSGKATAVGLARRLSISPAEAEGLLNELQGLGVVSPRSPQGRRVLMNHAQAEDAVAHAESVAHVRQSAPPARHPAPVTTTHHAPKPKAAPKPKPVEKVAPVAEKPTASAPTPNSQLPTPAAPVRLRSKGGTVVDIENGKATYVEVAPGSAGEVGRTFNTTEERLKAKGWTEVKEKAEPAGEKPQGAAPAPAPEGKEEAKSPPKAREEEQRPRSAPAEPAPMPEPAAAEESQVLFLEQRLAALPENASFGDFLDALPEETRAAVSAEQPVAEEEALPGNVIPGQDAKGRLAPPSSAERPKDLTAAKIAAVVKAGLDKVEAGQLVGVKDLKTQFTLTAPDPAKGPYAWTAQVTYRGLSPVLVGDPIFVNFANRPSNYALNPPAPPVRAEASAVPSRPPPDWAKIGARFEDDFQIRYELIGRDERAGTWMGQKVHIPERKWVVTPKVGELNMFSDRGLHYFEPLPGEAAPAVTEGPRELTPVPVVEERNDELPTAPPLSTQVKERGAKPATRAVSEIVYHGSAKPIVGEFKIRSSSARTTHEPSGVYFNDDEAMASVASGRGKVETSAWRFETRKALVLDTEEARDWYEGRYREVERAAVEAVRAHLRLGPSPASADTLEPEDALQILNDAPEEGIENIGDRLRKILQGAGYDAVVDPASGDYIALDPKIVKPAGAAQGKEQAAKPKTEVIASYNEPDTGVTAHVAKVGDQFSVALQDDESGEFLPTSQRFPDEAKARTAAKKAAGVKPKATEPAAVTLPAAQLGKKTTFTAQGKDYEGQWAIVEVGDLVTSHDDSLVANPTYPQEYQPRDRDELASQNQVIHLMQTLDPRQLGENVLAAHGAPVVAPSLLVESGNGRTIALRRLYRTAQTDFDYTKAEQQQAAQNRTVEYRQWVFAHAAAFGINPKSLGTMSQPVLVRIRTEKLAKPERLAFVHAANARETLTPSAKANAKFLAARLTPRLMEWFNPGADLNLNVTANKDWVAGVLSLFPPNDLGDLIVDKTKLGTKQVELSRNGIMLATDAVFYYAYGDEGLLAQVTLAPADSPVKRVTGAMLSAAGRWSTWRDRIKTGHAYDLDVTPDLLAAVQQIALDRQRKKPAGGLLPDESLPPVAQAIYDGLQDRKGSQPAMAGFLSDIADLGLQVGDPFADNNEPALFDAGEKELPTTREIVEAARRRKRSDDAGQASLLPASEAGPGSAPGGDGPEALATSTRPLGGLDREGEAVAGADASDLVPYVSGTRIIPLREGEWVLAHMRPPGSVATAGFDARGKNSGEYAIWPRSFPPPPPVAAWMAGDGRALARLFRRLARHLLTPAEEKRLRRAGLTSSALQAGVNLGWPGGIVDIFVNPFSLPGETSNVYYEMGRGGLNPNEVTEQIFLTMLHEIAHFRVREEGGKLWEEMDRLFGQMTGAHADRFVRAIRGTITKGGKPDEFSPQYQKARAAYQKAIRDWLQRDPFAGGSGSAGAGPPGAERVTRGVQGHKGGAGGDPGRDPGARFTRVTPSGEPEYAYPEAGQEDQFLDAHVENVRPAEPENYLGLLRQLLHDLTREFPHLRAGGRYAQFHTLMHDAAHAHARAREEAMREIDRIFAPLSKAEKGLFERALYVYNLAENLSLLKDRIKEGHQALTDEEAQAEADQAIRFPAGKDRETGEPKVVWTPDNVRSTKALFMRRVADSARVNQAIQARRQFVAGVRDDLIYWTQRATGRKLDMPREDYLHQMVLLHAIGPDGLARLIASPTGGGEVKVVSRGFMKARLVAGTSLAHNTSYVASELHWASQALADIVIFKLVADLGEREDLAPMVAAIAKAQNFELLMKRLDARAAKLPLQALPEGEFRTVTGEDLYRGMNVGIAKAFEKYGFMAAHDLLTREPSGRFDKLIEELADVWSASQAMRDAAEEDEQLFVPPKLDALLKDGIFQYSQWLLLESRRAGSPLPGAGPAGALFRAVALRQKEMDAILGEDKTDADRVAMTDPRFKGTSWWQAKPGRRIFSGLTLADRIGAELMEGVVEEAKITKDDLHSMPVLGGMNRRMLLPDPIKRTLEHLDEYKSETALAKVMQETVRPIKFAQLYNPLHTVDFFVRKFENDLHALIYGGWSGTVKEQMVPATKMVTLYVVKGIIPSEAVTETIEELASGTRHTVVYDEAWRAREFRHFLRFGALHMRYEMMGIDTETVPAQIEMAEKVGAYLAKGLRGLAGAGKMAKTIFSFWGPQAISILDGSMRFAAYLAAMQEMAATPTNRPKNVGFALAQEVKGVEGIGKTDGEQILDQRRRRAWLMADEMMVAYDKTPPAPQWLANHGFAPWLRWTTQNGRRIYRLLGNPAWEADAAEKAWTTLVDQAQVELLAEVAATGGKGPPRLPRDPSPPGGGGGGGGGEGKGPPDAPDLPLPYPKSFKVGANQAMLALSLYVIPRMVQYGRALFDPDSERDLPPEVRKDAHMILGHDPWTGKAMVWVRLSALDDVLAISDPWGVFEKVFQGKLTVAQGVMEMALSNPLKEMLQLSGPYQEMVDLLKKQKGYPDPLNPKYQEITTDRVLDVLGYGNVWRWATNQQRLQPSERWFKLVGVHEYGHLESNYYEVREMARDQSGAPSSPGGAKSAKSAALYQFVQAAKAGDKKGAGYYLLLYQLKGGTPNGIRESVRGHDPLAGMNDLQAKVFMHGLDAGDRQKVRGAYLHYRHEVDMVAGKTPLKAFPPINDDLAWLVSVRRQIAAALRQANPIQTLSGEHPENARAIRAAKDERDAAKHPRLPVGAK